MLLTILWTSRGFRCLPFFPPALEFNSISCRVQHCHRFIKFASSATFIEIASWRSPCAFHWPILTRELYYTFYMHTCARPCNCARVSYRKGVVVRNVFFSDPGHRVRGSCYDGLNIYGRRPLLNEVLTHTPEFLNLGR